MTEEQALRLIELMEEYNHLKLWTTIMCAIFSIVLILFAFIEIYRIQKVQKYVKEYKATLNDEQLETLKRYKKIND